MMSLIHVLWGFPIRYTRNLVRKIEVRTDPKLLCQVWIQGISKMGKRNKCSICDGEIIFIYRPMEQWKISGNLCGHCYGKKLTEYYSLSREATKRNP